MKKSFRRVLMVAAAMAVSLSVAAQFSLNAGYSSTIRNIKTEGEATESKRIHGATAGFAYDFTFLKFLGLHAGADYTFSLDVGGAKIEDLPATFYTTQYHTLGVPLRFMVNLPFGGSSKFFVYAGPKFAVDVVGRVQRYDRNAQKVGKPVSIYSDADLSTFDDFKDMDPARFKMFFGPGAGLKIKSFIIRGGYDWGITNLNREEMTRDLKKLYKNNWYLTFGVTF